MLQFCVSRFLQKFKAIWWNVAVLTIFYKYILRVYFCVSRFLQSSKDSYINGLILFILNLERYKKYKYISLNKLQANLPYWSYQINSHLCL